MSNNRLIRPMALALLLAQTASAVDESCAKKLWDVKVSRRSALVAVAGTAVAGIALGIYGTQEPAVITPQVIAPALAHGQVIEPLDIAELFYEVRWLQERGKLFYGNQAAVDRALFDFKFGASDHEKVRVPHFVELMAILKRTPAPFKEGVVLSATLLDTPSFPLYPYEPSRWPDSIPSSTLIKASYRGIPYPKRIPTTEYIDVPERNWVAQVKGGSYEAGWMLTSKLKGYCLVVSPKLIDETPEHLSHVEKNMQERFGITFKFKAPSEKGAERMSRYAYATLLRYIATWGEYLGVPRQEKSPATVFIFDGNRQRLIQETSGKDFDGYSNVRVFDWGTRGGMGHFFWSSLLTGNAYSLRGLGY